MARSLTRWPQPDDPPEAILTRNPTRVRADYRASIEYSLSSLISYVETYGDDNLVLIFLGDHQPSPIVTGQGASRDVPITSLRATDRSSIGSHRGVGRRASSPMPKRQSGGWMPSAIDS